MCMCMCVWVCVDVCLCVCASGIWLMDSLSKDSWVIVQLRHIYFLACLCIVCYEDVDEWRTERVWRACDVCYNYSITEIPQTDNWLWLDAWRQMIPWDEFLILYISLKSYLKHIHPSCPLERCKLCMNIGAIVMADPLGCGDVLHQSRWPPILLMALAIKAFLI